MLWPPQLARETAATSHGGDESREGDGGLRRIISINNLQLFLSG